MKTVSESGLFSQRRVLRLSKREVETLKRAQAIAEQIREHVGEDDYDNHHNMSAARVEHGIAELLGEEIVVQCRITQPEELATLFAAVASD